MKKIHCVFILISNNEKFFNNVSFTISTLFMACGIKQAVISASTLGSIIVKDLYFDLKIKNCLFSFSVLHERNHMTMSKLRFLWQTVPLKHVHFAYSCDHVLFLRSQCTSVVCSENILWWTSRWPCARKASVPSHKRNYFDPAGLMLIRSRSN